MKVLIISDTHRRYHYFIRALEKVSPIDLLIHLGDIEGGEEYMKSIVSCPIEFVSGNNDFFNGIPKEKIIYIGKYKVMLTHGHRYGVNYDTLTIKEAAKKNQVDIVMYGHTHVPRIDLSESVWAINPGSISLPRQNGKRPTFIIMEIDSWGIAHFTLNDINE